MKTLHDNTHVIRQIGRRSLFVILLLAAIFSQASAAVQFKVLVVMSYHEEWPWEKEVREGIEAVLAETCEITYSYMDTIRNLEGGKMKAEEAYQAYQELLPDGVITVDDNAQTMFVLPYLKDKVKTPVIFCGVNAEPQEYGFPASNVTGVLERVHYKESIVFAQQMVPSIQTIAYIMMQNSTTAQFFRQAQQEAATYPVTSVAFKQPQKTVAEALAMIEEVKPQADLLFIEWMEGLEDSHGKALTNPEVIPLLVDAFGKPTITANRQSVDSGVLCAVLKTGQEQGTTAAEMLLKAMQGTPVAEIPITQNQYGRRILNVTTLQKLGIKPQQSFLVGAELVKRTE